MSAESLVFFNRGDSDWKGGKHVSYCKKDLIVKPWTEQKLRTFHNDFSALYWNLHLKNQTKYGKAEGK